MKTKFIALLSLLLLNIHAFAATAVCTGQVTLIAQSNGSVVTALGGSSVAINICSLDATHYNTSPTQCKAFLNTLQLAFALGKTVDLFI